MELLLASGNAKKLREVRGLLEPLGVRVVAPSEIGGLPEVVEDQPDFAGNARKKAVEAALHTGRWCLADDSGLEVDALDGAPGVYSARFAGEPSDDARNNAKLLAELDGVPTSQRGARFVCALALADPTGQVVELVLGTAQGRILEHARGTRDFGYDPLFLFTEEGHPETGRGFAELEPDEKAAVSHRGRALRALLALLPAHLGARH